MKLHLFHAKSMTHMQCYSAYLARAHINEQKPNFMGKKRPKTVLAAHFSFMKVGGQARHAGEEKHKKEGRGIWPHKQNLPALLFCSFLVDWPSTRSVMSQHFQGHRFKS